MAMVFGVSGVLELARQKPAVLGRQLLGFADHARTALGRRCENYLCAEPTHDLAPLD